MLSYNRKQITLEGNRIVEGLAGKYFELYDFFDWPLELCWKGLVLSCDYERTQEILATVRIDGIRVVTVR